MNKDETIRAVDALNRVISSKDVNDTVREAAQNKLLVLINLI